MYLLDIPMAGTSPLWYGQSTPTPTFTLPSELCCVMLPAWFALNVTVLLICEAFVESNPGRSELYGRGRVANRKWALLLVCGKAVTTRRRAFGWSAWCGGASAGVVADVRYFLPLGRMLQYWRLLFIFFSLKLGRTQAVVGLPDCPRQQPPGHIGKA